jgi:hypothetical protein
MKYQRKGEIVEAIQVGNADFDEVGTWVDRHIPAFIKYCIYAPEENSWELALFFANKRAIVFSSADFTVGSKCQWIVKGKGSTDFPQFFTDANFRAQFTEVPEPEGHWVGRMYGKWKVCTHTEVERLTLEQAHSLCFCTDGKHSQWDQAHKYDPMQGIVTEKPSSSGKHDFIMENWFKFRENELLVANTIQRIELGQLNSQVIQVRGELTRLNEQVSSYQNEIGELETDVTDLKAALAKKPVTSMGLIEALEKLRFGYIISTYSAGYDKGLKRAITLGKSHALIDEKAVLEKERNRILQQIPYFVFYANNDRRNSESITLDDIRGIVNGTRGIVNGGNHD